MRLNKYLAEHGICSRREADRMIEQGRVTVNGQVASLGTDVSETDVVQVGKKQLGGKPRKVVLAYYKPVGVTCSEKDVHAQKLVADMVHYPERVTYAGRLDKDSEGLLLLTNDGDLIQAMMKGANRHEKEYVVRVHQEITEEFVTGMAAGVYLRELERTTRPCRVEKIGKYTFRIVLTQGLNRQIRRMCESFGYKVAGLKRVRVMNITLDGIPMGKYRVLNEAEMRVLYEMTGLRPGRV